MTATEMVDEVEGGEAEVVDEAEEAEEEEEDRGTIMTGGNQVILALINPTNPRHLVLLALTQILPPHILLTVQTWAAVI